MLYVYVCIYIYMFFLQWPDMAKQLGCFDAMIDMVRTR